MAAVTIDCAGSGKFLNITQGPASASTLEGLSIMGGSSQSSGGAVTVDGGRLTLRDCHFVNCESLASTGGDCIYYECFFEGGGAVAMSRAVSLLLEGNTFTNCRAPNGAGGAIKVGFEDELAKELMGDEWWRSSATAETMGLLQSRFDSCSAGTEGGAVAVQVGTWTSSISTLVEDTAFERSELSSINKNNTHANVQGGSLSMTFTDDVQDVTNTIRRTNMTDGVLMSDDGYVRGGGVFWRYAGAATNVHTLVMASIIMNMSLIAKELVSTTGGGFMVDMAAEAKGVSTTIEDSTIGGHTLQSGWGGNIFGGSVYLIVGDTFRPWLASEAVAVAVRRSVMQANLLTNVDEEDYGDGIGGAGVCMEMFAEATNVRTTIEDSTIGGHTLQAVLNSNYLLGGSVLLRQWRPASSVAVMVRRSFMQDNSLTNPGSVAGAGLCMIMYAEATNATTTIEDSTIGGHKMQSGASTEGGSVYLMINGLASSVAVMVRRSFMQDNSLTVGAASGGADKSGKDSYDYDDNDDDDGSYADLAGAGLYMRVPEEATNVRITIEDSTISNHILYSRGGTFKGGIDGGSVYLKIGESSIAPLPPTTVSEKSSIDRSVTVTVRRSFMQANSLTVVKGVGVDNSISGGGLSIAMFAEATNVRTTIEDSTIGGHTLQSAGESVNSGGAVSLWCGGSTAGDILMAFRNSIFEGNRGADEGGGVRIAFTTSSANTGFVRTIFSDCHLRNNTARLRGGAIYHSMQQAGASLELHRCIILDNYAGKAGGGIYARQIAANPPTNLKMKAEDNGPTIFPRYVCRTMYTGVGGFAREWNYGTSTLFIDASTISNNSAGDEDAADTVASGGGIFAQNLDITVRACEIAGNQVAGNGGGLFLDGGSARLSVEDNTSITANAATQDGSAIYSISGGGITLSGATIVDFTRDEAAAGIAVVGGGELKHGTNTLMRCAAGEQMLYKVTTVPASFNSWNIDCSQVRSIRSSPSPRSHYGNPSNGACLPDEVIGWFLGGVCSLSAPPLHAPRTYRLASLRIRSAS
jgi:hypothetical protein